MKLVFATHNTGKVEEMRTLLSDTNIEVLSADEAGVYGDVVEDGQTFEENALKKAKYVSRVASAWAVADDSGCCIDALNGEPGIHSARWAGVEASDEQIVQHTLEVMKDVPEGKRQAHFQTSLALVAPDGRTRLFEGRVNGNITLKPKGQPRAKLPYDAIFVPVGHDHTFAQMSLAEKNAMSHRGRAFAQLKVFLKTLE